MEEVSSRVNQAAEQFLATGKVNGIEPGVLAQVCSVIIRNQSETSLSKALKAARKFERFSRKHDQKTQYQALRSLARVSHLISNYVEAEKAYLKARALANGNRSECASIDRALVDLYMYRGNLPESRRRAKMAITAYKALKAPGEAAKTRVNFANVLHRQDKHREAEKLYREAAEYFEKRKDELAVARCYYNRANALVQLFELDRAEKLYFESNEIYARNGHSIDANDAMYGLAWLLMLKGDYHVALLNLTECEKVFQEAGHTRMAALCELDRAEVFLNLNLFSDALESARRAESVFDKLKVRYESSKSAFYRAKAAHAMELKTEAARAFNKALRGFKQEKNDGFYAAALLLNSQMASNAKKRENSINSAKKKFSSSQLPLWEAICHIHLGSDSKLRKEALERLRRNGAVRQVPHLFAQWQTLEGDRAENDGQTQQAKKHWQMAADCLDRVRAQLPPVELRTNFGASDLSPHRRLILAECQNRPLSAAVWSERYKTAGVWSPVIDLDRNIERAKVEQSLVDLARRVSSYSHQIRGIAGERGNLGIQSRSTFGDLQRRVQQELASIEKHQSKNVESQDKIWQLFEDVSKEHPLVQFHIGNNDILAFVHRQKETILRRFPDGRQKLAKLLRQWRFILEEELLQKHLGHKSSVETENRLFDEIGDWLWRPLEISDQDKRILVLPEGELANIPWQALRISGRPLAENHSFVIAPSLRHYIHAREINVNSSEVKVFVGESDDLPQVSRELDNLSKLSHKNVKIMNPAKRNDWSPDDTAELWHYSGHAYLRSDNPFYSYLTLADGPLFAADFRLKNSKVELVTLAACRSGEQVALSGEEATGLVRSLLEMGARNVIAGHWPVSDESTAMWMNEFYSGYFNNESLSDAAANASSKVKEKYPSAYHWAAFSVFGAGGRSNAYN